MFENVELILEVSLWMREIFKKDTFILPVVYPISISLLLFVSKYHHHLNLQTLCMLLLHKPYWLVIT